MQLFLFHIVQAVFDGHPECLNGCAEPGGIKEITSTTDSVVFHVQCAAVVTEPQFMLFAVVDVKWV